MKPNKVSIEIRAEHHNPTILHPSFLLHNNIVEKSWETVGDAISTPAFSVVNYAQGVRIYSQPDSIIFVQSIDELNNDLRVEVPGIASRYVTMLPHVDYREVNITISKVLPLDEIASKSFVSERFLRDGAWNSLGKSKPEAMLRLCYTIDDNLEGSTMFIDIAPTEKEMDTEEEVEEFGVNFEFTFNRMLDIEQISENRVGLILQILQNWEQDLQKSTTIWEQLAK